MLNGQFIIVSATCNRVIFFDENAYILPCNNYVSWNNDKHLARYRNKIQEHGYKRNYSCKMNPKFKINNMG